MIALLIVLIWQIHTIKNNWRYARAYEQEWVASSLIEGHGYSFDPATAWLGLYGDGTRYTRTAWVEPLYTFSIAAVMKLFGEFGRLILTLFNIVWFGASALLIFLLVGELLDIRVGLYTAILFLFLHACKPEALLYTGNAALAGLLYCLSSYQLLRCIKNPSINNSVLLGITIGIANLNHAGSLLFAPLSVLVILISLGLREGNTWRISLILMMTTAILLSPWILRNYAVFGKFVPVRSGFGYQLFIGNPGLAHTFTRDLIPNGTNSELLWTAENPLQALQLLRWLEYDAALADYSKQVVSENSSADYSSYNEVERDRVFLRRGLKFVWEEPLLSVQMMFWKTIAFLTIGNINLDIISIVGILGGLLLIQDTRVASLLLLVAGYTLPYVATLPLYYRYRSPIEPIFFVLSGLFVGVCLQKTYAIWKILERFIPYRD